MKILVTGATGFIGSALCQFLLENKHSVHYLTTSEDKINNTTPNYTGFVWNPSNNEIDLDCLKEVDAIVNLAGHTINCAWTEENKKKILDSRINCSNTLFNALKDNQHQVKSIVNASAIGIYQSSETMVYDESSTDFGTDFLADVCKQWEAANARFETLGIQSAITRFGLILSKDNGVLRELARVVSLGMGANLGNGKQWMSWVHYQEVVQIIYKLLMQQQAGLFNVVAPNAVRQEQFLMLLAAELDKPLWLPNIPEFVIKFGLGKRSALVLSSQHVQPKNLQEKNYIFSYPHLSGALKDLYK